MTDPVEDLTHPWSFYRTLSVA